MKRIKKSTVQFTVKVNADLLNAANEVRIRTWVELTETMLKSIIKADQDERLVGWGAGGKEPLRPIYKERKPK